MTMGDGFEADQLMMGGGAIRDGLAEMAQLGFCRMPAGVERWRLCDGLAGIRRALR